jgi:hypothetical protein
MITDSNGRPIASEGQDARKISIIETNHKGKMVWAIEYFPSIQAFEFEEVLQILGNAVMGIATNARARKHETMAMAQAQAKIQSLDK